MNAYDLKLEEKKKLKRLERRYKELEKQEKELRKVHAIDEEFVAKNLNKILEEKSNIAKIIGIS